MGHYAKIDKDNVVVQVIVAKADYINTLPDKDSWIKTSYNTLGGKHYVAKDHQDFTELSSDQSKALRGKYAGIGFVYDTTNDIFYDPLEQKYPSWTLNTTTATWDPPTPMPAFTAEQKKEIENKENYYVHNWNEDTKNWDLIKHDFKDIYYWDEGKNKWCLIEP